MATGLESASIYHHEATGLPRICQSFQNSETTTLALCIIRALEEAVQGALSGSYK